MNIQMPDIKAPQLDKHIANKTTSLHLAVTTRITVVANIEKGTANLLAPVQKLLAECLQEILADKTDAFYWCASTSDEIEQDIFAKVQMLMKQKMAGRKQS